MVLILNKVMLINVDFLDKTNHVLEPNLKLEFGVLVKRTKKKEAHVLPTMEDALNTPRAPKIIKENLNALATKDMREILSPPAA